MNKEIEQITDYSSNLSLLIEQYKESSKLQGLLDSANNLADQLEQALFELRDEYYLSTAVGVQLDVIGNIFSIDREGRSDSEYRTAIQNRAQLSISGEPEAIIKLLTDVYNATYVTYIAAYPAVPAAYYLLTDAIEITLEILERYSPAGVQPYIAGFLGCANIELNSVGSPLILAGQCTSLAVDDYYIYVATIETGNYYVRKYNKRGFSLVTTSPLSNSGQIRKLIVDSNFVYVLESSVNRLYKLKKSDLSIVDYFSGFIAPARTMNQDDEYLYAGGDYGGGPEIWKIDKYTMNEVAAYPVTTSENIYSIAVDDTYLYLGGQDGTITTVLKSNMSHVSKGGTYGGDIRAVEVDANYFYVAGVTTQTVQRWNKSYTLIDQTTNQGDTIWNLAFDESKGLLFFIQSDTSPATGIAKAYYTVDLPTLAGSSADYGNALNGVLTIDDDYIYWIGGAGGTDLLKYTRNYEPIIDYNGDEILHVSFP